MTEESIKGEDQKVYEVGYLVVPSVPEEHLAGEVANIRNAIESEGGVFISEEFPKLRPLTYTMVKKIGSANQRFNTAYFGAVKFDLSADKINVVKEAIEKNKNVLRYLIIKTVRENTMSVVKPIEKKAVDKPEEGEKPVMTEAEIDKSIEELVIE